VSDGKTKPEVIYNLCVNPPNSETFLESATIESLVDDTSGYSILEKNSGSMSSEQTGVSMIISVLSILSIVKSKFNGIMSLWLKKKFIEGFIFNKPDSMIVGFFMLFVFVIIFFLKKLS
jgi:hypothetical protein